MTEQQTLRSTAPHDPQRATLGPVWGHCPLASSAVCSQYCCVPVDPAFSSRSGAAHKRRHLGTNDHLASSASTKGSITRLGAHQTSVSPSLLSDKHCCVRKATAKGHRTLHSISTFGCPRQPVSSPVRMQDKMSLFSLLNPNDIDSGASASARSSPDPITPDSVASLPETWTPATRWSSLHRRNESFESTASSSSNQSPVALEPIRFPPFNDLDNNSRQLAMRFKVEPLGAIAPRQRPVSYNSDKRALKAKTGINKFHGKWLLFPMWAFMTDRISVFEYSFQLEGEDKKWHVMWDYRLGLVRFTPFFKCLKYNKVSQSILTQNLLMMCADQVSRRLLLAWSMSTPVSTA